MCLTVFKTIKYLPLDHLKSLRLPQYTEILCALSLFKYVDNTNNYKETYRVSSKYINLNSSKKFPICQAKQNVFLKGINEYKT